MDMKELEIGSSLFRKENRFFPWEGRGLLADSECDFECCHLGQRDSQGTGNVDLGARAGFLKGLSLRSVCNRSSTSTLLTSAQLCTWHQLQGRGEQGFVPRP